MKKFKSILFISLISLFIFLTGSCTSDDLKSFIGTPELKVSGVSLKSVDMEGFNFDVKYNIKNPYPVSLSLAVLNADIVYNGETPVTSISTNNGISIAAMDSKTNSASFKIPYSMILEIAKKIASGEKLESIPLSVNGKATLDTSNVPLLSSSSLNLPFKKSFEVPVFKPSLSVSSPTLAMPTSTELKNALINGGMSVTKAAAIVTTLISGKKLPADVFDGIDIDLKFNFNLNVKNEGSCSWKYLLDKCQINLDGNRLASVSPESGNSISSASGTIPVSCKLNTVQAGKYIVQLLNKTASDPTVSLDSKLDFPGISEYFSQIPLEYTKTIPVSSLSR